MIVSWEEGDIKCGSQVGKTSIRERLLIGYLAAERSETRFIVVSMSDGMTHPAMSRKELAIWLTEGGWVPSALLEGDKNA